MHPGMNLSGFSIEDLERELSYYEDGKSKPPSGDTKHDKFLNTYYNGRIAWMKSQIRMRRESMAMAA